MSARRATWGALVAAGALALVAAAPALGQVLPLPTIPDVTLPGQTTTTTAPPEEETTTTVEAPTTTAPTGTATPAPPEAPLEEPMPVEQPSVEPAASLEPLPTAAAEPSPGATTATTAPAAATPAPAPATATMRRAAATSSVLRPATVAGVYSLSTITPLLVAVLLAWLAGLARDRPLRSLLAGARSPGGTSMSSATQRSRLLLGVGLLVAAGVVGLVGYLKLSLEPDVNRQIPFLASAGIAVVILSAAGGALLVAEQLRQDADRLESLEEAMRQLAGAVGSTVEDPARRGAAATAARVVGRSAEDPAATSAVAVPDGARTFAPEPEVELEPEGAPRRTPRRAATRA